MRDKYKSDEERMFVDWLNTAQDAGLIVCWEYEPVIFELLPKQSFNKVVVMKTKTKTEERTLFQPATYEPDFRLVLSPDGAKVFDNTIKMPDASVIWIEIKGAFNPHQKDDRYDSLRRKLLHDKHGIYVQKFIPEKLFKATFCPEKYRWKRNRKVRTATKLGEKTISIDEFVVKPLPDMFDK